MVARRTRSGDQDGSDALGFSHEGGVDKQSAALAEIKRENGFWEPFNKWWRAFYEQTHERPKMTDMKW